MRLSVYWQKPAIQNGYIPQGSLPMRGLKIIASAPTAPFRRRVCLTLLLLAAVFQSQLHAQQVFGAITGTVKDPSGAAVPGATVKAVNAATNLSVSEKTQ